MFCFAFCRANNCPVTQEIQFLSSKVSRLEKQSSPYEQDIKVEFGLDILIWYKNLSRVPDFVIWKSWVQILLLGKVGYSYRKCLCDVPLQDIFVKSRGRTRSNKDLAWTISIPPPSNKDLAG
ncbi:hypothetical protein RIF29_39094 [Crotalaria pallida]|uniref:Uncharacterized protein n=1 Tax=Crotalaria pallida TaxID=3830 RepID=A0AAN9HM60_CROPI